MQSKTPSANALLVAFDLIAFVGLAAAIAVAAAIVLVATVLLLAGRAEAAPAARSAAWSSLSNPGTAAASAGRGASLLL
jgi:hypothetical protein